VSNTKDVLGAERIAPASGIPGTYRFILAPGRTLDCFLSSSLIHLLLFTSYSPTPATDSTTQAALENFTNTADLHPHPSFASIFAALQNPPPSGQRMTHAIVPIENSSNGTVVSLLDLLADPENRYPNVKVCAEHYLPVHHCLLAAPSASQGQPEPQSAQTTAHDLSSIKTLHTHPQVWTQCTTYLSKHLSHTERIDTSSTSAAAMNLLSSSHSTAAIASALAAKTFNLDILAQNIEDDGGNTTRFLVLYNDNNPTSNTPPTSHHKQKPKQKSLLTFTLLTPSRPGSLSTILSLFSTHSFNLTSIDTRPSRRIPWHYIFCVECEELDAGRGRVDRLLEALHGSAETETVRYLGSWEDALALTKTPAER
jgi:prephenate dehydratase